MLPDDEVRHVHYFTARVKDRDGDAGPRLRQQVYLRALATFDRVAIHEGKFLVHKRDRRKAPPETGLVRVIETSEKGSDVNLAVQLLVDGFRGRFERAVIVSNDSDLVAPIKAVRNELDLPVGVLAPISRDPHRKPSVELSRLASFTRVIREGDLDACHLPEQIQDRNGRIHRPPRWAR